MLSQNQNSAAFVKSMRGSPKDDTVVVRQKQFSLLQKTLGLSFNGLIVGDMNLVQDGSESN